jgi:dolichol-phosphate mannosyltransferase
MKNLLFIPCYQCAPQITRVLESVKKYAHFFEEILIIDNISQDTTATAAQNFIKLHHILNARVVINPANINLGGTHKLAFDYALAKGFDHVVILHGDDQGRISDIAGLLALMEHQKLDRFWMGARFHPSSQLIGYSLIRTLGNLVYNAMAGVITTQTIYDFGGSGLNVFPAHLINKHPYRQYANDLTFHVFLLLNAYRMGQPLSFTPISWREEDQISNVKLLGQSIKLLRLLRTFFKSSDLLTEEHHVFQARFEQWQENI